MEPAWSWSVGDPIGFGNDVGAPEVPYMSYGPRSEEEKEKEFEEEREDPIFKIKANRFALEAKLLYDEERYEDALVFINRAFEYFDDDADMWNRKGMILEALERYGEALRYYNEAIERDSSPTFKRNLANLLLRYSYHLKENGNISEASFKIQDAIRIFERIGDSESEAEAWNLKGNFSRIFTEIPDAFRSYKKAMELSGNDEKKETYRKNRDSLLTYIANVNIKCPKCGKKLKITDSYCTNCGASVDRFVEIILKKDLDEMSVGEV